MRIFYGTSTKLVLLMIGLTFLVISGNQGVRAEERQPIMDLKVGGTDIFTEASPSIVQIFNGNSSGSGYVIDREGHIITNAHVTAGSAHVTGGVQAVEVAFYGDEGYTRGYQNARWKGVLIAEDYALDLAIIKVEAPAEKFSPIRLGDSSIVLPGDTVATFGSPGGDPGWVDRSFDNFEDSWLEFYNLNLGVISEVLNFEESFWTYYDTFNQSMKIRSGIRDYGSAVQYMFHTDSAINHGNSGGPCLNVYGEAIGTNTWGIGGENVGMSVPVNLLKRSVTEILQYGRPRRPWCGFSLHPSVMPLRQILSDLETGLYDSPIGTPFETEPEQLKVYTVNQYSPAYEAGLREGDVILRINGEHPTNIFDIYTYILDSEIGDEITIDYLRNDQPMPRIAVELAEKRTRFNKTGIDIWAEGEIYGNYSLYRADLTY